MIGKLERIIVKTELYPDNYVLFRNEPKRIIRVAEKSVVLEMAVEDGKTVEKRVDREEVEDKVIKYKVKSDGKIFDLYFKNYNLAVAKENDVFDGYTIIFKSKVREGDSVKVDCLFTVDKHQLYDPNSRIGIVKERQGNNYIIELKGSKKEIKLHRNKFRLIDMSDGRMFFKIICPLCG